ncbi:O-antigen ligase family protein [Halospina sp. K52047b]|uniref:O-antigen ligase family protein n=1 Tax=Halospina sp. K52047b TaxID=2614160 RepID=UPI00178891B4|nr:O-antigen ligase family protein [Halospina sp. K52047b]
MEKSNGLSNFRNLYKILAFICGVLLGITSLGLSIANNYSVTWLVFCVLISAYFPLVYIKKERPKISYGFFSVFICYFLFCLWVFAFPIITNSYWPLSFRSLVANLIFLLVAYLVIKNLRNQNAIFFGFIFVCGVEAVLTILDHFEVNTLVGGYYSFRSAGLSGNPNVTAYMLSLGIVVLIAVRSTLDIKPTKNAIFLFVVSLFAIGILLTSSRSGLLVLVTLVLFFFKNIKLWFSVIFLTSGAALSINIMPRPPETFLRLQDFVLNLFSLAVRNESQLTIVGIGAKSLKTRMETSYASLQIFLDHPITGVGSQAFRPILVNEYGVIAGPHNVYTMIAAQFGAVGLITFFFFMAGLFSIAWKSRKISLAKGINTSGSMSMLAFLVSLLFIGIAWNFLHKELFWVFVILLITYSEFLTRLPSKKPEVVRQTSRVLG